MSKFINFSCLISFILLSGINNGYSKDPGFNPNITLNFYNKQNIIVINYNDYLGVKHSDTYNVSDPPFNCKAVAKIQTNSTRYVDLDDSNPYIKIYNYGLFIRVTAQDGTVPFDGVFTWNITVDETPTPPDPDEPSEDLPNPDDYIDDDGHIHHELDDGEWLVFEDMTDFINWEHTHNTHTGKLISTGLNNTGVPMIILLISSIIGIFIYKKR